MDQEQIPFFVPGGSSRYEKTKAVKKSYCRKKIPVPIAYRGSTVQIRMDQEQIPIFVPGVNLELFIKMVRSIRIHENFKIVVVVDDAVVVGQVGPELGFLEPSTDVEEFVVPPHFDVGVEVGLGKVRGGGGEAGGGGGRRRRRRKEQVGAGCWTGFLGPRANVQEFVILPIEEGEGR
jgi:hypothetical protein